MNVQAAPVWTEGHVTMASMIVITTAHALPDMKESAAKEVNKY